MLKVFWVVGALLTIWGTAHAAPHVSRAVSVQGALAYQDDADTSQFWYVPTVASIDGVGTSALKSFSVTYSGIGPKYYACTGSICRPSYGANVGATVNVDLTDQSRRDLLKEITRKFGIGSPKLAPVRMSNVKVKSLLVDSLSVTQIKQNFSSAFQFKTDVGFTAGSNGSNFGANLATSNVGASGVIPNPSFQLEFVGDVEFAGDPWIVEARCDLTQAWSYLRTSVSVSASLGWFEIGQARYENISEELKREKICTYKEIQGTLDAKADLLPILEMMKRIFEEMNANSTSGTGFFKFEPNPDPADVSAQGATSKWPWSVSINAGVSSAAFKQGITSVTRTEIKPRFLAVVGSTIVTAVKCTPQTKRYFTDLGDPSEPCITPAKTQQFKQIAEQISRDLDARLADLDRALIKGQITLEVYDRLRSNALSDAGGSLQLMTQPDGTTTLMNVSAY